MRGSDAPDLEAGVAAIRNVVKTLPARLGVYGMQDAKGEVLYVGKTKGLKSRVTNCTQVAPLPKRLQRMVSQTRGMTIVTTNTEAEALVREADTELGKQKGLGGGTRLHGPGLAVDVRANVLPVYDTAAIHAAAAVDGMLLFEEKARAAASGSSRSVGGWTTPSRIVTLV